MRGAGYAACTADDYTTRGRIARVFNSRQMTVLAALLLLPMAALAADISGTWKASFDTSIGKQEYTYTFVVKEGKLTGKAKWTTGESELTGGKVEGDTVSIVENFNYQGNNVAITYTGKVISADEIHFSRDVSGMAHEEMVARRAK
jgi:hypothetical protein